MSTREVLILQVFKPPYNFVFIINLSNFEFSRWIIVTALRIKKLLFTGRFRKGFMQSDLNKILNNLAFDPINTSPHMSVATPRFGLP